MQNISIRKKNNSFAFLAVACALIAILMIMRDVAGVAIPKYLFIGIAAIGCLFCEESDIYGLLAFITPIANGISYTYIYAVALLIIVIRKKHFSINKMGMLSICSILVIELLSAVRGGFDFAEFLRFSAIFLLTFGSMNEVCEEVDSRKVLQLFIAGYIGAMADLVLQMLTVYSFSDLLVLGVRLGNTREMLEIEEGIHLSYNPNGLAMVCLLAGSVSLILVQKKRNIIYYAVGLFSVLIGITTQSRAFILGLAVGLVIIIFSSSSPLKTKLLILASGFVVAFFANRFLSNYLLAFSGRMKERDFSNGRFEIAIHYFNEMFRDPIRPFLGVGMQDYQIKSNYAMSAHNAIQEILITWGILGLLLVIVLFISILSNAKKRNPSAGIIQYIPFILLVVFKQTGQGFIDWPSMLWFFVAFCAITYQVDQKGRQLSDETDSIYAHI